MLNVCIRLMFNMWKLWSMLWLMLSKIILNYGNNFEKYKSRYKGFASGVQANGAILKVAEMTRPGPTRMCSPYS